MFLFDPQTRAVLCMISANIRKGRCELNTKERSRSSGLGLIFACSFKIRWPMTRSGITAARLQSNYSTAEDKYRHHLQALNLNAGIKN